MTIINRTLVNYTLYSYLILIQTRFCMLLGSFPFSFCFVLFCRSTMLCAIVIFVVVYFVWLYVLYIYVYVTRVLCCQMLNKESRLKKQKKTTTKIRCRMFEYPGRPPPPPNVLKNY